MLAPRMIRVIVLLVGAALLPLACSVTPHFFADKPGGTGGGGAAADGGVEVDTPCDTVDDCAGMDGVCLTRACVENKCQPKFAARGIVLPTQKMEDCHVAVCDGYGHEISQVDILDRSPNVVGDCKKFGCSAAGDLTEELDDTDVPDDGNPCTTGTCENGMPSQPPVPNNTSCGVCLWCQMGTCMGCAVCTGNVCIN